MKNICLAVSLSVIAAQPAKALELDDKLAVVKKVYNLTAKDCSPGKDTTTPMKMVQAGKVLFETKSLSGDRDIACRTCHLDQFHLTDGLPIAVGVGGEGKGAKRYSNNKGVLVQRNAISLVGRGSSQFTAFFWDGKVQAVNGKLYSQFGDVIQEKFTRPLALAAILPIVERDEFIGTHKVLASNDIQSQVGDKLYRQRYEAVSLALRQRFLRPVTDEDKLTQQALVKSGVKLTTLDLSDIGERLATFIEHEFTCKTSQWDVYLQGDKKALTPQQKAGALIFYGKGRCAACHTGSFLSDFEFHSIGTPQGGFGPHPRHRDIGRGAITNRFEDLYKFRTPPLINVSKTGPYGHNGAFKTLRDVVVHHINPVEFYINNTDYYKTDHYVVNKLTGSRDNILSTIDIHGENDISSLVEFLGVL